MIAITFLLTVEYWIAFDEHRELGKYATRDVALKAHPRAELRGDERGESRHDRERWARNGACWRKHRPYADMIQSIHVDDHGFFVVTDTGERVPENATIERIPTLETFGLV
jgi:hypothetical protein